MRPFVLIHFLRAVLTGFGIIKCFLFLLEAVWHSKWTGDFVPPATNFNFKLMIRADLLAFTRAVAINRSRWRCDNLCDYLSTLRQTLSIISAWTEPRNNMERINSSVQRALKADKVFPRPHGSAGIWVCFLLPAAVILGCARTPNVSELYLFCAIYAVNTLLNSLHLLFHIFNYKSISVIKSLNVLCAIPAIISIFLYTQMLDLDLRRSLCYVVANALIYFEGIPFIFKVFPKTFTFGEANIFIQGLSLFIFSLFVRLNHILINGAPFSEYEISTVILQLSLSWVLLFCIVPYIHANLRKIIPMYIWGVLVLGFIYLSVYAVLNCDLFFWIWIFLTKPERIGIIILWLICSAIAVVIVQHQINKRKKSNTILRKYFHALAVVVFLSGTFLDVNLIYFSSGCVFGLFIVFEVFRILKLPPLYEFLRDGFSVYSDEKDSGVLALTPICLLVGNALPFWLHPLKEYSSENQLQLLSGVLSVGVGDTFASVGGKLFGRHCWKGSNKTIEGTALCILSQVLFIQLLVSFGLLQNSSELLVKGLTAIFVTSIAEAKTDQIDNIVLPLTLYTLLMI